MKRKIVYCGMFLCLLAAAVTGCSGGGNSATDKEDEIEYSSENMTMQKVGTESTVCKAGHSTQITVTINSNNSSVAKNVPVSVIFVKKTEGGDGETNTEEEQFYAGTYLIPEVNPGTASYVLNIIVPDIEMDYSSFSILAMFYNNLCEIYNGKDNISDDENLPEIEDESLAESDDIKLDPSLIDQPDLMIENATLSNDILVLLIDSLESTKSNNSFSITYDVQVLAKDISDARIKFYLKTLDDKKSWQMNINQAGTIKTEIELAPLTKYEKQTVTTDLLFPDKAFQDILKTAKTGTELQYPFYIQAVVSSASEPAEFVTKNNYASANLYVNPDDSILAEITHKKVIGSSYSKFYGNSYFGTGFSYSAYTGIDRDKIYSENSAKLPVHLFKKDFNFFALNFSFRTYIKGKSTDGLKPGIHVKASGIQTNLLPLIIEQTFFSFDTDEVSAEWKTEGVLSVVNNIIPSIESATQNSNNSLSFPVFKNNMAPQEGEYHISKSFTYTYRTLIGPIPVELGLSFTGGAGFGAFAGAQPASALVGFVPYFYANAGIYGCIGFKAIVSAGVGGELNIIEGSFKNVMWLSWILTDPNVNNEVFLNTSFNAYSGVTINMLRGGIYAFVTYPWPVFKKKKGIRYFAGFENKTKRKYFWETESWAISDDYAVLPKKTYEIHIPLDQE